MRQLKDVLRHTARPRFQTEIARDSYQVPVPPFSPPGVEYVASWGMDQNLAAAGMVVILPTGQPGQYGIQYFGPHQGG